MLFEGDEGGLGGVITPWVILGGWINLSVTGTPPKVIPEGEAPHPPSFTAMIFVTGSAQGKSSSWPYHPHLPLAQTSRLTG
jgi:hypothetical protein